MAAEVGRFPERGAARPWFEDTPRLIARGTRIGRSYDIHRPGTFGPYGSLIRKAYRRCMGIDLLMVVLMVGFFVLGRRVRRLAGQDMSFADVLELIISVALLVYLTIALVRPEWF